jgi:hypothetical protein
MSSFQIVGLAAEPFETLFGLPDLQLKEMGAARRVASSNPGFPCRVSLRDAEVGEEVLLLHFVHHPVDSPYQASGPIFIRRGASPCTLAPGENPECLTQRLISLRAYDDAHEMLSAGTFAGDALAAEIPRVFDNPRVAYLHLHNAGAGCYACKAIRAEA